MKLWRYEQEIEKLGKRYQLIGSLGSGGMADVCLAMDEREKREVAIKIIKPDKLDQATLDRFLKEAIQIQKLRHPHILAIYSGLNLELLDVARGSIVPYIVMEYARGGDLHSRLTRGQPYPFDKTLQVFSQLCSAVHYAHEQGVIHRDLKPHNILIRKLPDGSEQIALADFGMAVEIDATHHTYAEGGTPRYMAPEQFRGHAEAASDIFALGVILYQLTTGQFPFSNTSPFQNVISQEVPVAPSTLNPKLPKALDDVVLKALAKTPTQRFARAALFEEKVRIAVTFPPVVSSRPVDVTQSSSPTKIEKTPAKKIPVKTGTVPSPKRSVSCSRAGKRPKRSSLLITLAAFLILTTVVFGGVVLAAPNLLSSLRNASPVFGSAATVTLIPDAKTENNNYLVRGVQSNPDASKQEVLARIVAVSSASQSKTVSATGGPQTSATVASGSLTFTNGTFSVFTVASGTAIQAANGVTVITDADAHVPAAVPGGAQGTTSVGAHAANAGVAGDIGALTINKTCCSATNAIFVKNPAAFTGGQDAQNYTFVQQGDIQGVINQLQPSLLAQAESALKAGIHAGEQIASNTTCSPVTSADHNVDDRATSVTVTIKVTCQTQVYDQKGTLALVTNLFKAKAASDYGANYALVGNVVTQTKVQSVNEGIVNLLVSAKGVWAYQFTDARLLEWKKLIKGRDVSNAVTMLKGQQGVADVLIAPSSGKLPINLNDIKMIIQSVSGLSGKDETTGGPNEASTMTGPASNQTTQF